MNLPLVRALVTFAGFLVATHLGATCTITPYSVQCNYSESQEALDLTALVDTINIELAAQSLSTLGDDTPVVIEAWGGRGGAGLDNSLFGCGQGSRGDQGYARTNLTLFEMFEISDELNFYVGGNGQDGGEAEDANSGAGGAASLIIGRPISELDDFGVNALDDPVAGGVYVIAGGGGAGATCFGNGFCGGDGGDGGVAIAASPGAAVSAAGGDGGKGTSSAGNARGYGGNEDGSGSGGDGGRGFDGQPNIGGQGGRASDANSFAGWGSFDSTWIHGRGGSGSGSVGGQDTRLLGGAGGGGFGGGGAGGVSTNTSEWLDAEGDGGGGGGSWARAPSNLDGLLANVGQGNNPAGSSQGGVTITFIVDDAIVSDLEVTMVAIPAVAIAGDSVDYLINVINSGLAAIPSAHVADVFPESTTCSWTSAASGGATITNSHLDRLRLDRQQRLSRHAHHTAGRPLRDLGR